MEYKITKQETHYVIKITFDASEFKTAEDAVYRKDAAKFNVQGFRKGKAPKSIIEKNYGEDIFKQPAIEELFSKAYPQALREHPEIKPIDHPEVSIDLQDDGGIILTATVDVEPEFTLGKYTGLSIKTATAEIGDKDVDAYLERIRQSRARQLAAGKDHKIQNGDIAVIDFVGSVNGVEFEGGTAKNHELEIGSNSFIDTFEQQLIGKKIGDKIDVNVTFPKEYHAKNLAGAKALFKVEVRNVLIKELPVIDDTLAKEASEFETLAEFKKDISAKLAEQAKAEVVRVNENNLLKTITEQTKIKVPAKMVERQFQGMMADIEQHMVRQGASLDMYAKYLGMTMEQFEQRQHAQAEIAIRSRLVFDAIIEKENIKVTKEEIEAVAKDQKAKGKEHLLHIEHELVYNKLVEFLTKNNKLI